jgi:hypothetical protein
LATSRASINEITDGFSLEHIELPVENGPPGELAW